MTLQNELAAFHRKIGFAEGAGATALTVRVHTGSMLVPLPNIATRRRFLKYHDLHHLVTGYGVGRIGEGEVSAWELGTGSAFVSPMLGVMNLIALSTGLVRAPRRMWRAFRRGCRSRNLYPVVIRADVDAGRWNDIPALRRELLEVQASAAPAVIRAAEFAGYCTAAMVVHCVIALIAPIVRYVEGES